MASKNGFKRVPVTMDQARKILNRLLAQSEHPEAKGLSVDISKYTPRGSDTGSTYNLLKEITDNG